MFGPLPEDACLALQQLIDLGWNYLRREKKEQEEKRTKEN
jgi:hypothetical protein